MRSPRRLSEICLETLENRLLFAGIPPLAVNIAPMTWTQRSDWINVKTDSGIAHHAVGDGVTDDTLAIQDALNLASQAGIGLDVNASPKTTVYLPPGTYKISTTLNWSTGTSGTKGPALIGCGSNTTITWAGASGATMFYITGAPAARYLGIVWDGQSLAASAIWHDPKLGYAEDPVRHENEAFLNFTGVGLRFDNYTNGAAGAWTGGVDVWNCTFYNCVYGAQIGLNRPNDYEYMFEACEFEYCGVGIDSHGNTAQMVYDSHFSHSSISDMISILTVRARHNTSTGSKAFLTMPEWTGGAGQMHVIQDNWIDSWTSIII